MTFRLIVALDGVGEFYKVFTNRKDLANASTNLIWGNLCGNGNSTEFVYSAQYNGWEHGRTDFNGYTVEFGFEDGWFHVTDSDDHFLIEYAECDGGNEAAVNRWDNANELHKLILEG